LSRVLFQGRKDSLLLTLLFKARNGSQTDDPVRRKNKKRVGKRKGKEKESDRWILFSLFSFHSSFFPQTNQPLSPKASPTSTTSRYFYQEILFPFGFLLKKKSEK